MTVDKLFLENIDESINDENRIVTYKWLSQTLQVNCNTAKQMLFEYVDTERKVKGKDGLTVTYFLSGLSTPDEDGVQAFKCAVVPEAKLDSYKASYAILTSCHVYSVQKTALKDSNALFMTDYEKFKENVFSSNRYSGIQCARAELRSQEDMEMLTLNTVPAVQPDKKPAVTAASGGQKAGQKSMGKSDIQNMFAKTTSKKTGKDAETSVKTEVKQEVKPDNKQAAPSKKPAKKGGMDAFFTKQTDKKAAESRGRQPKAAEKKKTPEKKTSPAKTSASKTRAHESDEEEVKPVMKRRRTNQDLFDSDSGEEEMEAEPEDPIPPTPPREATPPPKPDSPAVEEEDPIPTKPPVEEPAKGDNKPTQKRRNRRRKQVNKTYMDKDGFMVTEKVWESESASETEEPVPVKKPAPATAKPAAKGKKSPKKPSPGKKGSGKQTSLTSFFKKA